MTHETLVCAEGVPSARLSALRDEALPTGEAERLRAHIAGCAACQARMADFDQIAGALRTQRELDPGDRIIDGVHARLGQRPSRMRGWRDAWNEGGGRRLWAGLVALAPVAAIILLFVYVFSGIARHPATSATPTVATATPFGQKPIVPSPTPMTVQVPTFTPAVSAATAWGGLTPVMSHTFAPTGSQEFIPQAFSPDLKTIGGVLFNASDSGAGAQIAQLAYYTVATGAITKLGPTWRGYIGPWGGMSTIDDRYIVYGFNNQPGATCGICHNTIWSLDRASGRTWQIDPGSNYSGDQADYESADHVAFVTIQGQVWVADLAAHTVTLTLPIGAKPATASSPPGPDERIMGFQWPYLIYDETTATTPDSPPATTLNILNLVTKAHTRITARISSQDANPAAVSTAPDFVALVGTTLYATITTQLSGVDTQGKPVNLTYGSLYRLDNAFAPGGQLVLLARWPISDASGGAGLATTGRVIALGSGYFWDTAERRLVKTSLPDVQIVGPYLIAVDAQPQGSPLQTFHITAYDTSTFPVRSGG